MKQKGGSAGKKIVFPHTYVRINVYLGNNVSLNWFFPDYRKLISFL